MVNHRDLPLPGTPQKADSPVGVRQRISRQLGAGSLEAKMVDDRAPAPVKLNAGKRSPAHSPRNAPEKVKDGVPSSSQSKPAATSAETNTNLVASLRRNSDFMLAFAVIGVICMMVQNELAWVWNTDAGYGSFCPSDDPDCTAAVKRSRARMFPITDGLVVLNAIRALISFTTCLTLWFCYRFYSVQLAVMKSKNLLPRTATLLGSSLRWSYMLESCALAVHVFPGIDDVDTLDPSLYLWMNLFMFTRAILLLRVVRYHSPLLTSNGRFIGALTNVEFNASFILKTALKHNPVTFMSVCLVTLFISAGYSIRLIDSLMCVSEPTLNCEPLGFWDAQWLLAITILTVGYGDFVPHADGARFVALVGGLTGTMITAVTIALTTSYLNLSRSESRVVTFLRKDSLKRMLQLAGARALQAFYRYYTVPRSSPRRRRRAERHLYSALARFRSARRYVLSHDPVSPQDRQISLLETMEVNVDDMKAHLELLGGYFIGVPNMVPGLVDGPMQGDGSPNPSTPGNPSPSEVPSTAIVPVVPADRDAGATPSEKHTTAPASMAQTAAPLRPVPPSHPPPSDGNPTAVVSSSAGSVEIGDAGRQSPSVPRPVIGVPRNMSSSQPQQQQQQQSQQPPVSMVRRRRRNSFVNNSDWVSDIREAMGLLTSKLDTLASEFESLQNAVARNAKATQRRIETLEICVKQLQRHSRKSNSRRDKSNATTAGAGASAGAGTESRNGTTTTVEGTVPPLSPA